jgi:hypothetical protein
MRKISGVLASVQPGLVGPTVLSGVNSSSVKVVARAGSDKNYVFAVNTQRAPITVQVHVPRLHDGPMQVFGEKRSVRVGNRQFVDTFQPLSVHVYVQSP